jgi:predicted nucleic acid-binding protein
MVLLDSNLFVIDRFFLRDAHYQPNKTFLQSLSTLEAGLSVFTLLELCGIASFNLTEKELRTWLSDFPSTYPVRILDPYGIGSEVSLAWFRIFLDELSGNIARKMTFGDAILLREAERYAVTAIITWNTKDFSRRTHIPVFTPASYP